MEKIKIIPVQVDLQTTANIVGFQVLTFDVPSLTIGINARFFNNDTEVANVPAQMDVTGTLVIDQNFVDDCLTLFNLQKDV